MKTNRKFKRNDRVTYVGKTWIVCGDSEYDDHRHLRYKLSHGAWKKFVRTDKMSIAG